MDHSEIPARRSDPYTPHNMGWKRIKASIRLKLRAFPALYDTAVKVWRAGRYFSLRLKWRLDVILGRREGTHVSHLNVDKIYWISPQKIIFSSMQEFSPHEQKGLILEGDWDRLEKRFDSLDVYIALRQVCMEGKRWADTVFYQRALENLNDGHRSSVYIDRNGLDEHCKRFEALYHTIKNNGFISQKELFLTGQIQDPMVAEEEVTVSVGRFGDLLFSDGVHRLAIAKLLGLPSIPVKITVRHKDWVKFRNELLEYARGAYVAAGGRPYQPATHPDLSDLPGNQTCEDCFQLIKGNTAATQGVVLDIGANLGYFCHRFEECGFDCYAVENDPPAVSILKRLARAENRSFKIIAESALDAPEIKNIHFNIVLALNTLHHFLKTRESHDKLVALLRGLSMDELFFEPALPNEPAMEGAYRNYSPSEFVKFILENTSLKKAVLIGTMADGRLLYKLSRVEIPALS